jgi:hypothetical protein
VRHLSDAENKKFAVEVKVLYYGSMDDNKFHSQNNFYDCHDLHLIISDRPLNDDSTEEDEMFSLIL